jgi:hypothetical protein
MIMKDFTLLYCGQGLYWVPGSNEQGNIGIGYISYPRILTATSRNVDLSRVLSWC